MDTLVDDVGSFPLPTNISREKFDAAYTGAREAIAGGKDIKDDPFLLNNFYEVVANSFKKKIEAGLDVVNYPQHYDMRRQLSDELAKSMSKGTYLVEEKRAVLPEMDVINAEAKKLHEELGGEIQLRVCILGPIELYLKEIGTIAYKDILSMFAENVKRFAKNSTLNSKYVKTAVISLDEPSFGFQDISCDRDGILDVFEKAFDFRGVTRQIHLHSSTRITDVLQARNIDVVSFEYAASPKNLNCVSKKMLEQADKQIRVGVARTDIDSIMAELYDRGVTKPEVAQLVENEETIRKRFVDAKEKYGDRMTFTGPDCGLGGWPTQEAAQLVLSRTVNAVRGAKFGSV